MEMFVEKQTFRSWPNLTRVGSGEAQTEEDGEAAGGTGSSECLVCWLWTLTWEKLWVCHLLSV